MALPMYAELRLSLVVCSQCGVEFAMPTSWQQSLKNSHATFYCPAGHSQFYPGKSDLEKAREEAEQLRRRLEFANNEARAQRQQVEREQRRSAAARGQATKLRNRIAAGQCPCCRKSFADLAEHMAERHPKWQAKENT